MRSEGASSLDKCTIYWDNFPVEKTCLIVSARSLGRQCNMNGKGEPAGVIAGGVASLAPKHIVISHESFGRY